MIYTIKIYYRTGDSFGSQDTSDEIGMSWTAQQKTPIFFSKEEIQWAVKQADYKYFGDYEFSDQQKIAVDILVWVAQEKIREYEEKA